MKFQEFNNKSYRLYFRHIFVSEVDSNVFLSHFSHHVNLTPLRIIGPSYRGDWICIAGFRDLQTPSFEIPWFLGSNIFPHPEWPLWLDSNESEVPDIHEAFSQKALVSFKEWLRPLENFNDDDGKENMFCLFFLRRRWFFGWVLLKSSICSMGLMTTKQNKTQITSPKIF